jgi:thiol-disulfide isomerase/thioredoxin
MRLRVALPLIFGLVLRCAVAAPEGKVPQIALKDLNGQKQQLSALRGNIVVLNFWATWCVPCLHELPLFSRLQESYGGKVRFIAVSIDEKKKPAEIASFLSKHDVKLETWAGATTDTMAKVGFGDIVPSTLILDQEGEAITRITGEAREEDIRSRVDWLLNGRQGQAPERALNRS